MATPVPQKIEIVDNGPMDMNENPVQCRAMEIAKDVNKLRRNEELPTVWNIVGNRE